MPDPNSFIRSQPWAMVSAPLRAPNVLCKALAFSLSRCLLQLRHGRDVNIDE
jgi:hypothetical protein